MAGLEVGVFLVSECRSHLGEYVANRGLSWMTQISADFLIKDTGFYRWNVKKKMHENGICGILIYRFFIVDFRINEALHSGRGDLAPTCREDTLPDSVIVRFHDS